MSDLLLQSLLQLETIHARHPQIGEDHVGDLPEIQVYRILAGGGAYNGIFG